MKFGDKNADLSIEIHDTGEGYEIILPASIARDEPPAYEKALASDLSAAIHTVGVYVQHAPPSVVCGLLGGSLDEIASRLGVTGATARRWAYHDKVMPSTARKLVANTLGLREVDGVWILWVDMDKRSVV